jgi:hypothetical protein
MKRRRKEVKRYLSDEILRRGNYGGFQVIRHPRYFNKPLSCQSGIHKGLTTRIIGGVVSLYCTKCGATIGQGIHDKTWSKRDIHKIRQFKEEAKRSKSNKEKLEESWEALQMLKKMGYTSKQIKKMMDERMRERRLA